MVNSSDLPQAPTVSVVMPVHNGLPYLDEAIESILGQSYSNFEFVILDDASVDGSADALDLWATRDPRIRIIHVNRNLGPAASSQAVAKAATASLVARMDADDISHPDRLRQQLQALRQFPDVGLVGSLCDVIDGRGRKIRGPDLWRILRKSAMVPFPHGAIMYRRGTFNAAGGYRQECEYWEDQDLVTRMAALSKILVIPRSLYVVRQTPTSTRLTAMRKRQEAAVDSMYRHLAALSDEVPTRDLDSAAGRKLDPRVFLSLGSVELWAGGRPRLFRRLLRQGKLSPVRRSLGAVIWSLWASASPHTLRAFASAVSKARNLVARDRLDLNRPVEWSPLGGPHGGRDPSTAARFARKRRAAP